MALRTCGRRWARPCHGPGDPLLERLPYTNLTVRRHDIVADAVPEDQFDLVHARWVLHWLPARGKALARMVAALRPAGWLLVEEPDFVTVYRACTSEPVGKVVTAGLRALEAMSGVQSEYGRHLFDDVCAQCLINVEALGRVTMMRDGSPLAVHLRLTIAKVQATLASAGAATAEAIEEALARLDDPAFTTMSALTMAVWGRRAA